MSNSGLQNFVYVPMNDGEAYNSLDAKADGYAILNRITNRWHFFANSLNENGSGNLKLWLEGTDFRGVLLARAEGEPLELAARVASGCADAIGRVVPVLAEVESELDAIRKAAAEIGSQHVGVGESFCLRMHRRGSAGQAVFAYRTLKPLTAEQTFDSVTVALGLEDTGNERAHGQEL